MGFYNLCELNEFYRTLGNRCLRERRDLIVFQCSLFLLSLVD